MPDIIEITPLAWEKINEKIASTDGKYNGVRVDIRTRGCSGYSYTFELTDQEPTENEKVLEKQGHRVIISAKAEMFVIGAKLDYVIKDKFTQGFDFINNNEASRCGCGESFSV